MVISLDIIINNFELINLNHLSNKNITGNEQELVKIVQVMAVAKMTNPSMINLCLIEQIPRKSNTMYL